MEEAFRTRLQELRLLVLVSLFLQVVLISTGSRRKYIRKKWVGVIIWLCYLSADVVAIVALGVLSRASGDDDQHSYAIMGLWGPFLLMHLGGPDSITAYALADNELWSRHFLGLIGQVGVAIYVLFRSWISSPINYVWFAIFAAGILKYGERTVVLFWASRDQFRKWMVSPPDPGPDYAKFMDEFVSKERQGFDVSLGKVIDIVQLPIEQPPQPAEDATVSNVVEDAYPFFLTFKQLFSDLILSFQDRETSLSYFRALTWNKAFGIVEVELGFIYDLFYTKAFILYSPHAFFLRLLSWLSTIAALVAFVTIGKNAYPKTEVIITYILLAGAILIEIYAVMIFLSSNWFIIWLTKEFTSLPQLPVGKPPLMSILMIVERALVSQLRNIEQGIKSVFRICGATDLNCFTLKLRVYVLSPISYLLLPARLRWSNGMGQYNVLDRCIEREPPGIIFQFLEEYLFWKGKTVPESLKVLIFEQLKKRVESIDVDKRLGIYRGDMILLQQMNFFENINNIVEVEFDQSVLLWHMATDFCYNTDIDHNNTPEETYLYEESCTRDILKFRREISVLLSNYMVHLLITSPFMLPSGIGQIRFQDTRAEAFEFFDGNKNISRTEACKMLLKVDTRLPPSKVKGDRSKSLLFDACRLAHSLQSLEAGERWEKISQAWLDILTFAAAQCKWNDHAEKLSQGRQVE